MEENNKVEESQNINNTSSKKSSPWRKMKNTIYAIGLLIGIPVYLYLHMPVLNIWFISFPIALLIIFGSILLLEINFFKRQSLLFKFSGLMVIILGLHIGITYIASLPIFRANNYKELIGTIEEKGALDFSKDLAPISLENVRIIDEQVADRLGNKVLGEKPSLGSQVDVGKFSIQSVENQLYWIAPLLHDGFFKWFNQRQGTPGYVKVSATNERDVQLVTHRKDGSPIFIKYQPNAYFWCNIENYVYLKGYAFTGTTDYSFEVDDNGNPYWVISLYKNTIGFSGSDVYAVITVDAETGEIQHYNIDNAPKWLDRIQPSTIVKKQLNDWGEYINGYINLSNEGKLTTTEGVSLVYGNDNRSYWYTGITSVGRDQGTVGFILVDTRTKDAYWYQQAGATETAAMESAQGKVQEKGYKASYPVVYNINGVATYVVALKDAAGLVKMVALVSVEDYSIVGVGNNVKEAVRAYKEAYNGNTPNNSMSLSSTDNGFKISTRVVRLATDVIGGNTFYYIYCNNPSDKVFIGSSNVSNELPLTMIGDSVTIFYHDGRTMAIDISNFDNHGITLTNSLSQEIKTNANKQTIQEEKVMGPSNEGMAPNTNKENSDIDALKDGNNQTPIGPNNNTTPNQTLNNMPNNTTKPSSIPGQTNQ